MNVVCPGCRKALPLEDVNVSTDVALCRGCRRSFSFAALVRETPVSPVNLNRPPKGAWLKQVPGGFELGATTRTGAAFILVPFAVVWSGGSLGGLYGSQIHAGEFNWLLSLIGLPFLAGSVLILREAAMAVLGKVVVTADGGHGRIFQGVGKFGRTTRFDWNEIQQVRLGRPDIENSADRSLPVELVRDGNPIRFGRRLSPARNEFLFSALQQLVVARKREPPA